MAITTVQQLAKQRCRPCEGGVLPVEQDEAETIVKQLSGWELSPDRQRIHRRWAAKDFQAGMDFLNRVAKLAEEEDHHPDVHLVGYRNVTLELSTHAIGGLSQNDFILAAKINELPIECKSSG
jgi:4a-hydroxytetrahydrobiopterin dehydratase